MMNVSFALPSYPGLGAQPTILSIIFIIHVVPSLHGVPREQEEAGLG